MSREWKIKSILLLVVLVVMIIAGIQLYNHQHYMVPIVAGPGVTKVTKLSDYCEGLKGTAGDTNVYFCLLYTSPSPRDGLLSRMPSSA